MSQDGKAAGLPERTTPSITIAIIVTLVAVAAWATLRAYTGIFEVLNVRVFVGALLVAIPMVAAGAMQSVDARWKVLQSVLGLATVVAGEGIGAFVSQSAPVVDKFTLIFVGVALVLPWLKVK